ncbi:amino acid ABC transporter ATP-binding protein [Pseudomonas sp. WHRI 8519]|uniref:amino acid ABC transporter ATP-binding protein n=1 Tax=Pseudomonas sp. WHRI 8519 TaxID=3162567 RepID=UPI0032F01CEF
MNAEISFASSSLALDLSPQSTVLRLDGVSKRFGDITVLKAIDFELKSGEVVALIGPSGSGKSTLLRCINQLEPPTAGTVTIGDLSIDASVGATRAQLAGLNRKLGMVFQSFNLFPHMSVLENVSLAQRRVLKRSREDADERSMQLLERVGLASKAGLYPSRCSGGQQQRIAISRALALDPQIMLFDEPTSALDPEVGLEVLAVMRELADEGMTMMVVTHEMRFAENVSNRVIVMADGEIIEQGESAQVMRSPQHPRVQQFLSAVRDR